MFTHRFKGLFIAIAVSLLALSVFAACTKDAPSDVAGVDDIYPAAATEYAVSVGRGYGVALTYYTLTDAANVTGVTDPQGKPVAAKDGRFFLAMTGEYEIAYPSRTESVTVFLTEPEADFVLSHAVKESFAAGESVVLPAAQITDVSGARCDYSIRIEQDGTVKHIGNVTQDGAKLVLYEPGVYAVVYWYKTVFGERSTAFSVAVTDERTIMTEVLPAVTFYGQTRHIGTVLGYYRGSTYAAALSVTEPGGMPYAYDKPTFTFHKIGEYSFTVRSVVDGVQIEKIQTTSVVYEGQSLIANQNNVTEAAFAPLPAYASVSGDAFFVKGTNSSTSFDYASILDLRLLSGGDDLFSFVPYASQTAFMNSLVITLTDIYDPDNSIRLYWLRNPWGFGSSYLSVQTPGSPWLGRSNETASYGQVRETYGSSVSGASFRGHTFQTTEFRVQFDYAERAVYTVVNNSRWLVLDLDSTDPGEMDGRFRWDGFTTGEVYMNIRYASNTGSGVYITSLAGIPTATGVFSPDTKLLIPDTYFPEMPAGVTRKSYLVPSVTVSRVFGGRVEIGTFLFKDGISLTHTLIDNRFTPQEAGRYTLVYKGLTDYGAVTEVLMYISVLDAPAPIIIELPAPHSARAGGYYKVPPIAAYGGSGGVTVSYAVYQSNAELSHDSDGRYRIGAGELRVVVTATDRNGSTESDEYTVSVDDNVQMIVLDRQLPRAVKAGTSVTLPNFTAYDYLTSSALDTEVVINGTIVLSAPPYTFTVPDTASLEIVYYGNRGKAGAYSETFTVPVISASSAGAEDILLFDDGYSVSFLESGMCFSGGQGAGSAIALPYALPAQRLNIAFALNADYCGLDGVTLALSDFVSGREVRFTLYEIGGGKAKLRADNSPMYVTVTYTEMTYTSSCGNAASVTKYAGKKYYYFDMYYVNALKSLVADNGAALAAQAFTDSTRFNGFDSGRVYLTVAPLTVTGAFDLVLSVTGNQKFSYFLSTSPDFFDMDNAGPMIYTEGDAADITADIHSVYSLLWAQGLDVLQGETAVTVTALSPTKTLLNNRPAADGMTLTLDEYGYYRIIYRAIDRRGNVGVFETGIYVKDNEPPTVELQDGYLTDYAVGETLRCPGFHTADNTGVVHTEVLLRLPDGKYVTLSETGYSLVQAGSYTLVIRVEDGFGNVTRKQLSLHVTA